MTPPRRRLLILGAGRSGTGYIARLLTAAGALCGHESVYGPPQALNINPPVWHHYAAEASWLAVAALKRRIHPGPIRIQLRHPLDVIDSLDRLGLLAWERDPGHNAYRAAVAAIAPEVFAHPTPLARAAHFVTLWPFAAGHHPTYTVEDLDADTLTELLATLDVPPAGVAGALATVPQDVNAARARGTRRARQDVADHLPADLLTNLALLYAPHYPDLETFLR